MLPAQAPPADPSWLTAPRVAATVAALGGGAFAAWLFRSIGEEALWRRHPAADWLTPVLFLGTSALTLRAVTRCVAKEPRSWVTECVLHGAINGLACMWVWAALVSADRPFDRVIALGCCLSFVAPVVGGALGVAFCAGYSPVLALARRARREPSLDLVSRMVPWCAAWLTAIGAGVGLALVPQTALGLLCLVGSAALLGYGLYADRARGVFLDRLAGGLATSQRFTRDASGEAALPFVAGLGDPSLSLVTDSMADEGPFRSQAISEVQARFTEDPERERRAIRRRRALSAALLALDVAAIGVLLAC